MLIFKLFFSLPSNIARQGYNHLLTYGGRGWSLIDTSDMSRVYDSGDVMETYYTSDDVKDPQKAVYNDYYSSYNTAQTANKDKTSPLFVSVVVGRQADRQAGRQSGRYSVT